MAALFEECAAIGLRLLSPDVAEREAAEAALLRIAKRIAESQVAGNSRRHELDADAIANKSTNATIRAIQSGHRPAEAVGPHLMRTIRNAIIDVIRRLPPKGFLTALQTVDEGGKARDVDPVDPGLGPEGALLKAEEEEAGARRRHMLHDAIRALDEKCRQLVTYILADMGTQEDLARTEGTSGATIRKRTQRCMERLTEKVHSLVRPSSATTT